MKTTPVAPASSPEVGGSADDREPEVKEKPPKPPKEKSATWGQFLRYFTAMDWMLVSLAFVGELIAGVAQPAMLLVFNDVFKSLGAGSIIQGVVIPSGVLQRIVVTMAYIGAAIGGGQWASGWAINHVTARQMVKYKTAYLKAVLRQDVGWYDTSNPEELTTKFAESMLKVTKALKSIPPIFNGLGYGFGGLVVALVPTLGNPEVAGVTLATVPILIIAASGMMYVMQTGGKKVSDAYAEAGGTVTECLFSMRTIAALGIQRAFIDRYAAALKKVRRPPPLPPRATCCLLPLATMRRRAAIPGSAMSRRRHTRSYGPQARPFAPPRRFARLRSSTTPSSCAVLAWRSPPTSL